jgi:DNA primase
LDVALPFATDVRSVKFLFLPAEHDPDSYIRQFGPEAFARCVSEAMPLSRFLIDAAREGCDLGSAEGRAHLASNAQPLWMSLPDGALKRQLLAEFAELIQLGLHELQSLWQPVTPAPAKWQRRQPTGGQAQHDGSPPTGCARRFSTDKPPRGLGRQLPASRADHAVRLLLSDMRQWQDLNGEEHHMLCELPAPHGPLFTWLDSQHQEHGSLPWGALREGLREHPSEALALKVMDTGFEANPTTNEDEPDPHALSPQALARESAAELKALLTRLLIERLKAQETQAIASAQTDPTALERYRALQARRRALENPPEV